jgi:hypothetical protein
VYDDKKIALSRRALKWERCDVVERHERSLIIVCPAMGIYILNAVKKE